jgi:hypothetical protein
MQEIAVQQPVEDINDPVVEHGTPFPMVDGYGLGAGTAVNRLTPALPISTAPNGIPVRATPPGGADDVAADNEGLPLELVPQVPGVGALPGNDVSIPIPPPS